MRYSYSNQPVTAVTLLRKKINFQPISVSYLLKLNFCNLVYCQYIISFLPKYEPKIVRISAKVIVQGVGGHFATLCREFDFYEVKKNRYYFSKRKGKYFYTFNHFYSEKSSNRAK